MKAVPYILLGWLLCVGGCYALGALVLARLRTEWTRQEALALRFLAGAPLYALITLVLGFAHLYYRGVFVALPLLLLAWAWRRGDLRLPAASLPELPIFWRNLSWLAAPFTVLYFFNAMAPEASPDGAAYHLGFVARYYREHAMMPIPINLYAGLTQGMEMLFLAAFAIGRHSAAALMHFQFLVTLPWLMQCLGRRYGFAGPATAAALLVYISPLAGVDGISAYNDMAAAAVVFALFCVLRRFNDEPEGSGLPILAGLLAGFGFAIKYTLYPAVLLTAGWILWIRRSNAWAPLFASGVAAALSILPWLTRNALWYRNPLAPFFNHWFPNSFVNEWFEVEYRHHMSSYALPSKWEIPWQVTVSGDKLGGQMGPVFLLLPLALLALRSAEGRRLLLAGACFLVTYPENIGARFLLPPLPFLAMAMTAAFPYRLLLTTIVAAHAVLSWPAMLPTYAHAWSWGLQKVPWKEALRLRSEENFIQSKLGAAYAMAREIEARVPLGRRILGFNQIPEAYSTRDYIVGFQSTEAISLREIYATATELGRQPIRHIRFRIPKREYPAIRIRQHRDNPETQWSITELRLYRGQSELPRSPHWRLRASASPEWLGNAFDNTPVTRWMSGEPIRAGSWIEVDFGRPEEITEIVLQSSPDQPWEGLEVLFPTGRGRWEPANVEPAMAEMGAPRGLRRQAVLELMRRNVHYIASSETDHGHEDLALNTEIWGVEEIAHAGHWKLFRLLPDEEYTPPGGRK